MHRLQATVCGVILLATATQALACRGYTAEHVLFFDSTPDIQPQPDLIARVALSPVHRGFAKAQVWKVEHSSRADIVLGSRYDVRYEVSSCGPHLRSEGSGLLVANIGVDQHGHVTLYPYTRIRSGSYIYPPRKH